MPSDEDAIRSLVDTWMRATKDGDMDTLLDLMTDDVVFTVVGQEPFGKEAFAAAAEKTEPGSVEYEGTSEIRELKILKEWAYMRSYLRVRTIPADGSEPVHRSGYTLTILRKGPDGKWRLSRDANLLTMNGSSPRTL